MKLKTETNTPEVRLEIEEAAYREDLGRVTPVFEHGQWWVVSDNCAQYAVVDCQNTHGVDYIDFEQVTEADVEYEEEWRW